MARIRAALFDIDGTLLDSNDAHAHAWHDVLRAHGHVVPLDLVRTKIGMGGDRLLRELAGIDPESPEGREIRHRRTALFRSHYVPDLGPFPGARALVDRLRSRGLACVAVTAANEEEVQDLLRAAAVLDLFEFIVHGDDAERTKPAPDPVSVGLERAGVSCEEAVMVGDTPYDIEAARRAGVSCIAFRSGGWGDEALDGAVAIYDGPADLASSLDESPFGVGLTQSGTMPRAARYRRPASM